MLAMLHSNLNSSETLCLVIGVQKHWTPYWIGTATVGCVMIFSIALIDEIAGLQGVACFHER